VDDSGRGIVPAFLPYVFDAFRQEDASSTRARGGLGLGLAITKQLVELHGGSITAQSAGQGHGAKFTVQLPVGIATPALHLLSQGANPLRAAAYERPDSLRGKHVLVVDDEDDARTLVATVLENCGCRVTTADSVQDAMQHIDDEVPDILLSDIGMPQEDGYSLIRKVRALPRDKGGDIPAAALTAYTRAEDRRRMLNAGFSIHLGKPIDPAELVAAAAALTRFIHRAPTPS
jgi:CheY-like chemotaxis protein